MSRSKSYSLIITYLLNLIMLVLHNFSYTNKLPTTLLCRTISPSISKRHMLAVGSKISMAEKMAAQKIAHVHKTSVQEDFIIFLEQALSINPKIAQHMFSVLYPTKKMSLTILEKRYPQIAIIDKNHTGLLDVNDAVATAQAAKLKTYPFYQETRIHVLINPTDPLKACKGNPIAIAQTGQKNPDYRITRPDQWSRYQDYKTGQYNINSGHVYLSNTEEYEDRLKIMLHAQFKRYLEYPPIRKVFEKVLSDKTLSFSQKNDIIHNFFLHNLQKFPDINPSLIFKESSSYNVHHTKTSKVYESTIHGSSCFSDLPSSEITMAKTLAAGGKRLVEYYVNQKDANPNIVRALKQNWAHWFEEVD